MTGPGGQDLGDLGGELVPWELTAPEAGYASVRVEGAGCTVTLRATASAGGTVWRWFGVAPSRETVAIWESGCPYVEAGAVLGVIGPMTEGGGAEVES